MGRRYIYMLDQHRLPRTVGHKAQALRFLHRHRFRIPLTLVCTWQAYDDYVRDDVAMVDQVAAELDAYLDPRLHYAVRSSANLEDGHRASFAGQFKSVLNVRGDPESVLSAMWSIWATTSSDRVRSYLASGGSAEGAGRAPTSDGLRMAILIQEMVHPVWSGVAFSRNPITGDHEVIIEAVEGYGEALLQGGVTPRRWVWREEAWAELPEDEDRRHLALMGQIVAETRRIADLYGAPVDLEWACDGETLTWLQMREISSLSNLNVYSNRQSREFLPGIILPLVWSVNIPLVNGAWIRLLTELIGSNELTPEQLAKAFHYRAYFNVGLLGRAFERAGLPATALEGPPPKAGGSRGRPSFRPNPRLFLLLPRWVRFLWDKLRFARRIEAYLPSAGEAYRQRLAEEVPVADADALLAGIDELYAVNREAAYFNVVTPLLNSIHSGLLRRRLQKAGLDFEALHLGAADDELRALDPNTHLAALHERYQALPAEAQAAVRRLGYAALGRPSEEDKALAAFAAEMDAFLDRFGHLSNSGNDFSSVPWRETPDLILALITDYTPQDTQSDGAADLDSLPLDPRQRRRLERPYRRALAYRRYREQVGSLYTLGYGLFRRDFLALGHLLAGQGVLAHADDIFYLYWDEVRAAAREGAVASTDYRALVAERRDQVERVRDITLPETIYGDRVPPPTGPGSAEADVLTGTPTSRGYYRGPVRVVRGLHDFGKVATGDVLVVPFSDVGWAPLFTKAGAVVAESGGILSHSSIVAREYGIPAVVSVAGACTLADGLMVAVDGFRGQVILPPASQAVSVVEEGSDVAGGEV